MKRITWIIAGVILMINGPAFGMQALAKKQQDVARQLMRVTSSPSAFLDDNSALIEQYAKAIFNRQEAAYEGRVDQYGKATEKESAVAKANTAWTQLVQAASAAGITELKKTDPAFIDLYNKRKQALYDADIMQRFGQLDVANVTAESFSQCEKAIQTMLASREKNKSAVSSPLGQEGAKIFFQDVQKFAENLRDALTRKAVKSGIDLNAPQVETKKEEPKGTAPGSKSTMQDITPEHINKLDKKGLIALFGLPDQFNIICKNGNEDVSVTIRRALDNRETLQAMIDQKESTIKSIYKQLSLKLYPDKNPGNKDNAQKAFGKIEKFYKALMVQATEAYEKAEKFQNLGEMSF